MTLNKFMELREAQKFLSLGTNSVPFRLLPSFYKIFDVLKFSTFKNVPRLENFHTLLYRIGFSEVETKWFDGWSKFCRYLLVLTSLARNDHLIFYRIYFKKFTVKSIRQSVDRCRPL